MAMESQCRLACLIIAHTLVGRILSRIKVNGVPEEEIPRIQIGGSRHGKSSIRRLTETSQFRAECESHHGASGQLCRMKTFGNSGLSKSDSRQADKESPRKND